MALKFFWMFVGSFFACSMVLMVLVKNFSEGFAKKAKQPVIYGSLSSVLISGGAYLSTLITDNLFTVYWILCGIFLLFGIFHVAFFHKKYFTAPKQNQARLFLGEILFALSLILFTIVVFSSLQYFLASKSFLFYPMLLSTLFFFLPILVNQAFAAAYKIPEPIFNSWSYPARPIDLPDEGPNEKLLVIAFEIAKKATDKATNFRAKGPDAMPLGELFYHFINDYNEFQSETPILFMDKQQEAYDWFFRVKPKWYQPNRILDPNLSMKENDIRENSVIICERILQQVN